MAESLALHRDGTFVVDPDYSQHGFGLLMTV